MKTNLHSIFVVTSIASLMSALLLSCTTTTTPAPEATATHTPVVCQPSEIQTSESGFSEIQGTMHSDGEVWALLFFGTAHADQELKIVWRMTGTGEKFTVEARHEDGTMIEPSWGPEVHEDSTWERPGAEWGTGFIFPQPGCWTLTARFGSTSGEIRLAVVAP